MNGKKSIGYFLNVFSSDAMKRIMNNYFKLADKANVNKLTKQEISKFLEKLNLKIDKAELKILLKVCFLVTFQWAKQRFTMKLIQIYQTQSLFFKKKKRFKVYTVF
jgi:hypothetical protein